MYKLDNIMPSDVLAPCVSSQSPEIIIAVESTQYLLSSQAKGIQ